MMYPLSPPDDFTTCVADAIRLGLEPFADFGMQVNVAVFWVDDKMHLHALAHLDRLPIINQTLRQCGMSADATSRVFLADNRTRLDMLYQMIGADPHPFFQQIETTRAPVLHAVE